MDCNLSKYRINHFSQFGEDGVVEKLFEIAGIESGWLVEFGAWDAVHLSNTRYHYLKGGFNLLLSESDKGRYEAIRDNYVNLFPDIIGNTEIGPIVLNATIKTSGEHSLNNIFSDLYIREIALLSIDVDGEDLNIWNSLDKNKFRPKVVVIEFGKWQDSEQLDYLVKCFEDYTLVCVTGNFIFVDSSLNISSKQSIHDLIRVSGMQEFDRFYSNIDAKEEDIRNQRQSNEKDLYSKLAGHQIIYY